MGTDDLTCIILTTWEHLKELKCLEWKAWDGTLLINYAENLITLEKLTKELNKR